MARSLNFEGPTDPSLEETGRETLKELDEAESHKVGEKRSSGCLVLLVRELGLEDAEGKERWRKQGKQGRGRQSESKQVERDQEDVSDMSANGSQGGTNEHVREHTTNDKDDPVDIELLLEVPDYLRPAEDLPQLTDLLLRGSLGILNGRVLSRMVKLCAEAVDSLSQASCYGRSRRRCSRRRCGRPSVGRLGSRG